MRVLVCGGREFADRQLLNEALNRLRQERGVALVIAGGARGADAMAEIRRVGMRSSTTALVASGHPPDSRLAST